LSRPYDAELGTANSLHGSA